MMIRQIKGFKVIKVAMNIRGKLPCGVLNG